MNQLQQLPATQKSEIEFVPYGSQDPIKLSVNIIKNYVAIPTKSGKLPDDRECIRFLMLCKSRRLNPFEGDCFLQGYDGRDGAQFSLITAHQAFLKRAEHHPEYDGMRSGVIVRDDNNAVVDREGDFTFDEDALLGAWATVYFKTRKQTMHRRLKLSTFRKPFGRWNDDAAGMIVKCAEADALRSSFPTLLGGLYSAEEGGRQDQATSTVRLADLSDLGPVKQATTPAATQGNAAPQPAGTASEAPKATETPAKSPESLPEPASTLPTCAHCGQPMTATHDCPGLQEAISKQAERTGTPAEQAQQEEAERKELMASVGVVLEQNQIAGTDLQKYLEGVKMVKKGQRLSDVATGKLRAINKAVQLPDTIKEIRKQATPAA